MLKNKMFLEGVALGSICGALIASVIAYQIGEEGFSVIRRSLLRLLPRKSEKVHFELLLQ